MPIGLGGCHARSGLDEHWCQPGILVQPARSDFKQVCLFHFLVGLWAVATSRLFSRCHPPRKKDKDRSSFSSAMDIDCLHLDAGGGSPHHQFMVEPSGATIATGVKGVGAMSGPKQVYVLKG